MQDFSVPCMEPVVVPLASEGPPVVAEGYSAWLLPRRKSVGQARAMLREYLANRGGGELQSTEAELVLSELVTNAVKHGTRPDQRIRVGFELDQHSLYIAVEDPSKARPTGLPQTMGQETGRGLLLVDALAEEWGCEARDGVGKRVWCRINLAITAMEDVR